MDGLQEPGSRGQNDCQDRSSDADGFDQESNNGDLDRQADSEYLVVKSIKHVDRAECVEGEQKERSQE